MWCGSCGIVHIEVIAEDERILREEMKGIFQSMGLVKNLSILPEAIPAPLFLSDHSSQEGLTRFDGDGNNGQDVMDIGSEVGYVSFNSLEVACLEMRGKCKLTSFPPPATRSVRLCNEDKHGKFFAPVMRPERKPVQFLLGHSDRKGDRCIRQEANIHKAVINAHILEITKSLLDQFRREPSKYEILNSDRIHFGTGNMRIDRYLPRERYLQLSITINLFLRFLGITSRCGNEPERRGKVRNFGGLRVSSLRSFTRSPKVS